MSGLILTSLVTTSAGKEDHDLKGPQRVSFGHFFVVTKIDCHETFHFVL